MFKRLLTLRHSFSFRLTLLCFSALLLLLFALRAQIYFGVVRESREEIKTMVRAQFNELNDWIEDDEVDLALNNISAIIENDHNRLQLLAYTNSGGEVLEGNLVTLPYLPQAEGRLIEIALSVEGQAPEHYFAIFKYYPNGTHLLVAHSLRHAEKIGQLILRIMAQNLVLSLLTAIVFSTVVTYAITRKLRTLNRTVGAVKIGRAHV